MAEEMTGGSRSWEEAWGVAEESELPHEVHFALHQLIAHASQRNSEDDWKAVITFIAETLQSEPSLVAPGVLHHLHEVCPDPEVRSWSVDECAKKGVTISWFRRQMTENHHSRRTRAKHQNHTKAKSPTVASKPNVRWPSRTVAG